MSSSWVTGLTWLSVSVVAVGLCCECVFVCLRSLISSIVRAGSIGFCSALCLF